VGQLGSRRTKCQDTHRRKGAEHGRAQSLLRARYTQLEAMEIGQLPVIVIRIERVASWGDLG